MMPMEGGIRVGAGGGHAAQGVFAAVARLLQLGHGQPAEDDIARHGRAGAGAEEGVGTHHGEEQTALDPAQERVDRLEGALGDACLSR